ncbi:MAG: ABC transporter permease [Planctomycetes bacterium]|nr:ABC transporter permease [Planctomycetota bacterium]
MSFVRTYDSATAPRGVLRHILPLAGYPALIWRNRFTVNNFFRRELMGRFHGSFLGAWWMLVQPLFQFTVYYLVFGIIFGDFKSGEGPDPTFAIYLFSGIIVFHALIEAVGQGVNIVTSNSNLVKKVAFPSEVLIVPPVMNSIVIYLVGAIVCLVLGVAFGVLHPGLDLLALPLVLLLQFALTIGIGLFLGNLNVFIRDISQLWRILSMAWMFTTPIFWEPTRLTSKFPASILPDVYFSMNPGYSLVMAHRIVLGGDNPVLGDLWTHIGWLTFWATFYLVLGYSTFVSKKHKFADLV